MEDIPDTQPADIGTKDIPSRRRVCKVLLNNDYWCRQLSFSPTKSSHYQRYRKRMENIANNGDFMQQQLTQALEAYLQKLDDEARIEAINAFRRAPPLQPLPLAARRLRAVGQTGAGRPQRLQPE